MADRRYAVLIAGSRFPDEPRLQDLRLPENDVDGLNAVLGSEERGQFSQTYVLKNRPSYEVLRQINQVLRQVEKTDQVLIFYSGHGKLNRTGQLHLATVDTVLDALESTSVPVQSIKNFVDVSPSTQVALILDCCYSGAVGGAFTRGDVDEQLQSMSAGRGTYIMTASTGTQVAVENESDEYGVFTNQVIRGIERGEADQNGDGLITMDELYSYVRDRVREEGAQQPMKWDLNVTGELVIARSGRMPREERRNELRSTLLDLARQDILPDMIVSEALPIIATSAEQLSDQEKKYNALLDELLQKKITHADFTQRWFELERRKEPTVTKPPEEEVKPEDRPPPPEQPVAVVEIRKVPPPPEPPDTVPTPPAPPQPPVNGRTRRWLLCGRRRNCCHRRWGSYCSGDTGRIRRRA